jgi:hypothetical protein
VQCGKSEGDELRTSGRENAASSPRERAGFFRLGWLALVESCRRHGNVATASKDAQLFAFDREWLETQSDFSPEFGCHLMSCVLHLLGNRLREARIRIVSGSYRTDTLAIRTLLDKNRSQLPTTSPLQKLPATDALQTLELLCAHGEPLEANLAQLCLDHLAHARCELEFYGRPQDV